MNIRAQGNHGWGVMVEKQIHHYLSQSTYHPEFESDITAH